MDGVLINVTFLKMTLHKRTIFREIWCITLYIFKRFSDFERRPME